MYKQYFIIIFFGLTFSIGFAQDSINFVDSLGMKQGNWIEFKIPIRDMYEYTPIDVVKLNGENYILPKDFSPIVKSIGKYVNNSREGVWIEYYSNDSIISRIEYKNGIPNGDCKLYYTNGKLKLELQIDERTVYCVKLLNPDGSTHSYDTVFKKHLIKSIYE